MMVARQELPGIVITSVRPVRERYDKGLNNVGRVLENNCLARPYQTVP